MRDLQRHYRDFGPREIWPVQVILQPTILVSDRLLAPFGCFFRNHLRQTIRAITSRRSRLWYWQHARKLGAPTCLRGVIHATCHFFSTTGTSAHFFSTSSIWLSPSGNLRIAALNNCICALKLVQEVQIMKCIRILVRSAKANSRSKPCDTKACTSLQLSRTAIFFCHFYASCRLIAEPV